MGFPATPACSKCQADQGLTGAAVPDATALPVLSNVLMSRKCSRTGLSAILRLHHHHLPIGGKAIA